MRGIQLKKVIWVYGTLICIMSVMSPDIGSAKLDPKAALGIWFFDEGKGGVAKDSSETNVLIALVLPHLNKLTAHLSNLINQEVPKTFTYREESHETEGLYRSTVCLCANVFNDSCP